MNTMTLNAVATDIVGNYNVAGKHLTQAWRRGVERTIEGAGNQIDKLVNAAPARLLDTAARGKVQNVRERVKGMLLSGVNTGCDRTISAMDTVADRTHGGLGFMANTAQRVESALGVPPAAVQAMRSVNMPGARLALRLAEVVVKGSKAIEARVDGDVVAATVKAKAKPVSSGKRRTPVAKTRAAVSTRTARKSRKA